MIYIKFDYQSDIGNFGTLHATNPMTPKVTLNMTPENKMTFQSDSQYDSRK
jgi:hypothetical protein